MTAPRNTPLRALLSVHDKTGLAEFGRGLVDLGWELVASGGTARALTESGLLVTPVERLTSVPEMLDGRVKTLHPAIHAGILARDSAEDMAELTAHGYAPFAMVVCNLYPFRETVARPGITPDEAIEQIDIGGVTLLRAAAKNFARVAVLCDPADFQPVYAMLRAEGTITGETRRALAVKAFAHTRDYDAAIHAYLMGQTAGGEAQPGVVFSLALRQIQELRYGENPHQRAAYYAPENDPAAGPLGGEVLGGKALSYNNLLDLDAAWRALELFDGPTVVIVKHLNPCGIASAGSIAEAFPLALASDPVSAFGGVIAVNQPVDEAFVAALGDLFIEAVAAPNFTEAAQEILGQKRKNCRLLRIAPQAARLDLVDLEFRSVRGGVLVQSIDRGDPTDIEWRVVSQRVPTEAEMAALRFAWKACQAVKSNAIVLARLAENGDGAATVGIGGGLPSRVDAARLAVLKAGERAAGSVMASDAFFPFADGLQVGIEAGATAAVEPGGSIRDDEVIAAADAAGIALVFTGVRHFRH